MAPVVYLSLALTQRQAEALLEAATRAQGIWNDLTARVPDRPCYPTRLALDEAVEELKEAME
jgi:hypothetical protein